MCIDAYVTIRSHVLRVHSLITHLQLKRMSVMYESAYDAMTFHLLETSSITTPNQKQFRIFAQGTVQLRWFFTDPPKPVGHKIEWGGLKFNDHR